MTNRQFKDFLRLSVHRGYAYLSNKEVEYLAERLEASGDCTRARHIMGLAKGNISRTLRNRAWMDLERAYRKWANGEKADKTAFIVAPFIEFYRDSLQRYISHRRKVAWENYQSELAKIDKSAKTFMLDRPKKS